MTLVCKAVVPVTLETDFEVIPVSSVKQKCVFVSVPPEYVIKFPCTLHIVHSAGHFHFLCLPLERSV